MFSSVAYSGVTVRRFWLFVQPLSIFCFFGLPNVLIWSELMRRNLSKCPYAEPIVTTISTLCYFKLPLQGFWLYMSSIWAQLRRYLRRIVRWIVTWYDVTGNDVTGSCISGNNRKWPYRNRKWKGDNFLRFLPGISRYLSGTSLDSR